MARRRPTTQARAELRAEAAAKADERRRARLALAKLPHETSVARVENLLGLRLGRHARRVLLDAPGPDELPAVLPADDQEERDATTRAQRRLAVAGLVTIVRLDPPARALLPALHPQKIDCPPLGAVRLTRFGQAVVDRLGDELAAGARIRWADHVDALREAIHRVDAASIDRRS